MFAASALAAGGAVVAALFVSAEKA